MGLLGSGLILAGRLPMLYPNLGWLIVLVTERWGSNISGKVLSVTSAIGRVYVTRSALTLSGRPRLFDALLAPMGMQLPPASPLKLA